MGGITKESVLVEFAQAQIASTQTESTHTS
jgi:hypothetical protein